MTETSGFFEEAVEENGVPAESVEPSPGLAAISGDLPPAGKKRKLPAGTRPDVYKRIVSARDRNKKLAAASKAVGKIGPLRLSAVATEALLELQAKILVRENMSINKLAAMLLEESLHKYIEFGEQQPHFVEYDKPGARPMATLRALAEPAEEPGSHGDDMRGFGAAVAAGVDEARSVAGAWVPKSPTKPGVPAIE
jgi:hypothetical protein